MPPSKGMKLDNLLTCALFLVFGFALGVIVVDDSLFKIKDSGDFGGLLAGLGTFALVIMALQAKNEWFSQLQHQRKHQITDELMSAALKMEMHGIEVSAQLNKMISKIQFQQDRIEINTYASEKKHEHIVLVSKYVLIRSAAKARGVPTKPLDDYVSNYSDQVRKFWESTAEISQSEALLHDIKKDFKVIYEEFIQTNVAMDKRTETFSELNQIISKLDRV